MIIIVWDTSAVGTAFSVNYSIFNGNFKISIDHLIFFDIHLFACLAFDATVGHGGYLHLKQMVQKAKR